METKISLITLIDSRNNQISYRKATYGSPCIILKLLNDPSNSLYNEITSYCYLVCLPTPTDVKTLNDIGIKYVVNMCAEYNDPQKDI